MSFQLALLLTFPREVFHLAPPLPLNLEQGPRITSALGQVAFYFDEWDAPNPNRVGGAPVTVDAFFAHFVPSAPPPDLERALTTEEHPYAPALYRWGSVEEERERGTTRWLDEGEDGEEEKGSERSTGREWAEARLLELRRDDTRHVCDRLFADPVSGRYLRGVGDCMREAIRDFLTLLKTEFGQYLIPRTLPVTTARNQWILPDGTVREVGDIFLSRLLGLRSFADAGDINRPIEPRHWPDIAARLEGNRRPQPLEVLLASARGRMRSGPRQSSTGPDRGGHRAGGRGEGTGHAPPSAPRHRPDGRCSHRTGHPARRPRRGLDPKGTRSARGRGRSGALRPLCGGDTRVQ